MAKPPRRLLPDGMASYSPAVRWLVVVKVVLLNMPYSSVSGDLSAGEGVAMSHGTISAIMSRYYRYGTVETWQGRRPLPSTPARLHAQHDHALFELLADSADLTLDELRFGLRDSTGTLVSPPTLCRALWRLGLTRGKVPWAAASPSAQRPHAARRARPSPGADEL